MARILLPPELDDMRLKTKDQIRKGMWIWTYELDNLKYPKPPKQAYEVYAVDQYTSSETDTMEDSDHFFTASSLDSSGLIETRLNFHYRYWGIGETPLNQNSFISPSKEYAKAVYEYLEFHMKLLRA